MATFLPSFLPSPAHTHSFMQDHTQQFNAWLLQQIRALWSLLLSIWLLLLSSFSCLLSCGDWCQRSINQDAMEGISPPLLVFICYLLFVICYLLFVIFYFLFSIFLFICIELTYCTVSILHHHLLHPSLVGLKPLYGIISSPSFTFLHPTPFFYSFFTFYLFMFYFCVGMMTKRCTGRTGLTQ